MDKVELVSLDREELAEAEEEGVAEKELKLKRTRLTGKMVVFGRAGLSRVRGQMQ